MAAGYSWSIMVMMASPFLIIGVIALLVVRQVRRANRAARQGGV